MNGDNEEGARFCIKCGTFYYGIHSECPHTSQARGQNIGLANALCSVLRCADP